MIVFRYAKNIFFNFYYFFTCFFVWSMACGFRRAIKGDDVSIFRTSVFALLLGSMLACSYETRHIQYSLAVRPDNEAESVKLRKAVQRFSHAEGFLTRTEAGNEKPLEKDGRYLFSFAAADKSFISVTNVLATDCYDIGVHSSAGAEAAKMLGKRLGAMLQSNVSGDLKQELNCSPLR